MRWVKFIGVYSTDERAWQQWRETYPTNLGMISSPITFR